MRLARFLIFFLGAALAPLLLFSCADASEVGVNYGRLGNDLLDPESVVQLLMDNGITMVRMYDTNSTVLNAMANTGIKVMVMMPNGNIADAARSRSYALDWVRRNVAAYLPDTEINGLAVGNEVFEQAKNLTSKLLPAMINVQAALAKLGLDDAVKVTTPVAFDALREPSFPPSGARFRDDIAQSVMKPMLQFLQQTGSYLTINPYPFLALAKEPQNITLEFALGSYEPGVPDPNSGHVYHSLLDAMRDATFFAIENLTEPHMQTMASGSNAGQTDTVWTETGWPSRGQVNLGKKPPRDAETSSKADTIECPPATVANAKAYNNYVINRVLSGDTGTPRYPYIDMDVYIFALFNENEKGDGADDAERYFGLFYPDGTKVYDFDFQGTDAK
ncbi:hypothetical protein SETIT_5G203400v2 [Setaria italica]|uniref:Glucan endo-1,3-beta-D-glucosidase n=1 Tax=Setaria italica TaxID=4555 RepID=K3XIS0_SETIT|nr:glucan endo-1,3-beta-glucosidase 13 [Setaria italica]RCV25920.1 hypothetical protein SETIT_5G203400v2 [Setaria italica]